MIKSQKTITLKDREKITKKLKKKLKKYKMSTSQVFLKPLFDGLTQPKRAQEALLKCKKTKSGRPVDPSRIFLYEMYKDILSHQQIFFLQNNNLNSSEFSSIRKQLSLKGFGSKMIRNSIFRAAVRDMKPEFTSQMDQILVGPTLLVFSDATDVQHPDIYKDFIQIISKESSHKMLLVGAKLQDVLVSNEHLQEISKLPNIIQLRSQLVGLLSLPAQRLVGTLGQSPLLLTRLLSQHAASSSSSSANES